MKRADVSHSQAPLKRRNLRALIDSDFDDDTVVLSTQFPKLRPSISESSPVDLLEKKKRIKLVHVTFADVTVNPDSGSNPDALNSDGLNPDSANTDGINTDDPILSLSDSEAPPTPGKRLIDFSYKELVKLADEFELHSKSSTSADTVSDLNP